MAKAAKMPWRETTNHNYEIEKDLKPLKATALTNAQNYRVHLLPRSYNEKVADIHPTGFKMTSNHCDYLPTPSDKLQTKEGKERLTRNILAYETHVQKKKDEYDYFMNNKRTIYASRMKPRWAPTANHG